MSKQPSHPFIGFVVKQMDIIHDLLATEPGQALTGMLKLIHVCDQKVRTKETWIELEENLRITSKDRFSLSGEFPMDTENKLAAFDSLMLFSYLDFYSQLWGVLWDAGYMDERTFGRSLEELRDLQKEEE